MKSFKSLFAIVAVATVIFVVSGCGSKEEAAAPVKPPSNDAQLQKGSAAPAKPSTD